VLPSDMVEALIEFDSVRVIYPDFSIEIEPPLLQPEETTISPSNLGDPWGMRPSRTTMQVNEMHELGYRGAGVLSLC